jgi:hypothetical protein
MLARQQRGAGQRMGGGGRGDDHQIDFGVVDQRLRIGNGTDRGIERGDLILARGGDGGQRSAGTARISPA